MRDDDPRAGTIGNHGPEGPMGEPGMDAPVGAKPERPAEPKRRGRPRCAEEPCGSIAIWLPDSARDRIIRLARQRKQPVSEYLRDVMVQLFAHRS